jgi:hypothetical protein
MKLLLLTFTAALISGCADTPENRQFWQQIGAGLQGAGNSLNQQAAQMRQSGMNNNTVTCTTTNYGTGTSKTTCDGQPTNSMTCTTTNLGAGMARITCY